MAAIGHNKTNTEITVTLSVWSTTMLGQNSKHIKLFYSTWIWSLIFKTIQHILRYRPKPNLDWVTFILINGPDQKFSTETKL